MDLLNPKGINVMGEAKRRKEQGLAPKTKKASKEDSVSLFVKYPRLPYIIVGLIVIYLIFDLVKYYNN